MAFIYLLRNSDLQAHYIMYALWSQALDQRITNYSNLVSVAFWA
jgi:hypothetical protein